MARTLSCSHRLTAARQQLSLAPSLGQQLPKRTGASSSSRTLTLTQRRRAVSVRASDASAPGTGTSATPSAAANAGKEIVPDTEIAITKV